MLDDAELLRRYAAERSEAAFAELVRRHLGPVYAFALRRVGGDAHLAKDVAQAVFISLARKAASLAGRPVLGGWLCRATHFAARDIVRAERRRRAREQEAHLMSESSPQPDAPIDWEKVHPVLNQALGELNDDDRDAVWLRFFEGRTFADAGVRLHLTENAARMRVERALDKLHAALARRGVTSTAAAIGGALASHAGMAAPAGLAASVTGGALSGAAAGTFSAVLLAFMAKTTSTLVIGGLIAIGAGLAVYQWRANAALEREVTALRVDHERALAQHRNDREALQKATAELQAARGERAAPAPGPIQGAGTGGTASPPPRPVSAAAPAVALESVKDNLARVGNLRDGSLQDAPGFDEASIGVLRAWIKQDPEAVVRWLGTVPTEKKQREHTTEALIALELDRDPELAFLLANSIANDRVRANRLGEIVRRWAERDAAAVARAIPMADVSEAGRQRLREAAERAGRAR